MDRVAKRLEAIAAKIESFRTAARADGEQLEDHPKWERIVKEWVDDTAEDMANDYEDKHRMVQVERMRGFRFGSGTNGGWGAEYFVPLSYIDSTGKPPPAPAVTRNIASKAIEAIQKDAAKEWLQSLSADIRQKVKDFAKEKGEDITPSLLTEPDFPDTELGYELEDWERANFDEEDFWVRIAAFYYAPDNREAVNGQHTIEVIGTVQADGHFLRMPLETFYEKKRSFKNERDLREALLKLFGELLAKH